MTQKITILNRALSLIGERPITNPDSPETNAGKFIAGQLDQARREVIRRYPWNFAETWAEIDKTNNPNFGYSNAYSLPEDFLRLLFVGDPSEPPITDFRIMNQGKPNYRKVIALDNNGANKLKIGYSADIELFTLWDPLALKILSIWMALDAARVITGGEKHVIFLDQMLSNELKDAVGVDGSEQPMMINRFSKVQEARDQAQWGGMGFTNVTGYY